MKIKFKDLFRESFKTLSVNRLRTGLAILGIIIGIGSVIALVSLGESSAKSVQTQIESLGSNLLTVQPGASTSGNVRGAMGSVTTLTKEDALAIKKLSSVSNVSPEVSQRSQVTTGKTNTNTQIYGVTSAYKEVRKLDIDSGLFISESDIANMTKVAILGPTVSETLFGENVNPIGKSIKIGSVNFTVIGIAKSKGGTGFNNQDDIIYIPLSTAQKQLIGKSYLNSIAVEVKDKETMTATQNEVGYLLLNRHKLSDPSEADFRIMSQEDIIESATEMTGTLTTLLTGIAAISLVVGGIGIMNIMLVTVTERTREIGLRKALGATKKIVVTQFLMEAVILTITGGVFGIIIGILTYYIYSRVASMNFTISFTSIILAFSVSVAIGIIFGWYPARKASNLQPIEALRYE